MQHEIYLDPSASDIVCPTASFICPWRPTITWSPRSSRPSQPRRPFTHAATPTPSHRGRRRVDAPQPIPTRRWARLARLRVDFGRVLAVSRWKCCQCRTPSSYNKKLLATRFILPLLRIPFWHRVILLALSFTILETACTTRKLVTSWSIACDHGVQRSHPACTQAQH